MTNHNLIQFLSNFNLLSALFPDETAPRKYAVRRMHCSKARDTVIRFRNNDI
ncbi:MAG: hypothetical protein R3C26_01015 [Calditrichia bacterium]